jgi:hypothetical protein
VGSGIGSAIALMSNVLRSTGLRDPADPLKSANFLWLNKALLTFATKLP